MNHKRIPLAFCATALPLLAAQAVGQLTVQLDPSSQISIELCVLGSCDFDSSPVTGTISIELDDLAAPTQITLHDFNLQATEQLDVVVDFGLITGRVEATASGLATMYGGVGPTGPVPVVADAFSFLGVPADLEGTADIHATNIVCFGLVTAGVCPSCPCDTSIDLGSQGTQSADLAGTITAGGGSVTLAGNIDTTVLFDPGNPDAGSLRVTGTISGTVVFSCADANCDGSVDAEDIDPFFVLLGIGSCP